MDTEDQIKKDQEIMNKTQTSSFNRFIKNKAVSILLFVFIILALNNNIKLQIPQRYRQSTTVTHVIEERYLAYLPHSGLSNQRIELANGLVLANMLNRTLLIPPAFLGTVFGWLPREELSERLEWLTTPKPYKKICIKPASGQLKTYVQKARCEEYRQTGVLSWTELHDLSPLQPDIKYKFQDIMSMEVIRQNLNLSEEDIYMHHDTQLYDWRLYENQKEAETILEERINYVDSFAGRRYYKVFTPQNFDRKEKLLFLGGVFGSTRLRLEDPTRLDMQERIRRVLQYRLDTPLGNTVQSIVQFMGGKGSFLSLHFRTGDKPFKNEIAVNLESFMKNMADLTGSHESKQCKPVLHEIKVGQKANVYMATDHRNPKGENGALSPWFHSFPCTTALVDVPEDLFAPLVEIRDMVSPSKPIKNLLIPLIDAMVAAHGRVVFTTPRSTFSKYIEELHQAWVL